MSNPQTAESEKRERSLGRPRNGKSSNPSYRQVTAWVRRDTYDEVSKRLIDHNRREFSELVQALMEQWLQETKK